MAGYIGSKASVVSSGAERKKTFTITGATTSLTGLNYTVGKVHVFQNGVRLVDGTDYTATNGTTITLTVAAQSGDNVVVISQASFQVADALLTSGGTMTGDLTVQGAFTSKGIDDNGDATAITIDSSENVLIGKTATGISAAGHSYKADGTWEVRRDISSANSSSVGYLSRGTTDGNILTFYKDTTTLGSIGVEGGDVTIGRAASGLQFRAADPCVRPHNMSTNSPSDNAVDLGRANTRFKDAYLSGGIYLGGVGAANKLEDYEEGSYNTTLATDTSSTVPTFAGTTYYVKVGSVVHIHGQLAVSGSSSGGINLHVPLPFTPIGMRGALTVGLNQALSMKPSGEYLNIIVETSSPKAYIVSTAFGGGHSHLGFDQCGSGLFTFSGSYRTA